MSVINAVFGKIMMWCYYLVGNYGLAILLFTLLSKLILLPVSIWVQKNSIKMVKIQPEINFLKARHFGDADAISEGQSELFKREGYSPLLSTIPTIIQLVLLMGVIAAIKAGMGDASIDMHFCGLDLTVIPKEAGGWFILAPVFAGLSAYIMCANQNLVNVLQSEQSKLSKYGMMVFSVGLSLFLGWYVTLGVVLYWIASNLLSVVQLRLLNYFIKPSDYIDYEALEKSREELNAIKDLGPKGNSKEGRALKKREKADYKRFFGIVNKHLVFYSEGSGFYKYYKGYIEYILENTNIIIHYVTADPNDIVFEIAKTEERLKPYYIGEKKLIVLMMKLDADVVAMTMPELDKYHIKKSYVRDDIEYVYIPHCLNSINLTMRTGAINNYNTIFDTGKHQKEEDEKTEALYNLPKRKSVEAGYPLLDDMIFEYEKSLESNVGHKEAEHRTDKDGVKKEAENRTDKDDSKQKPTILIAPSWQQDNIIDSCLDTILGMFMNLDYKVIVRPHPQHVRHNKKELLAMQKKFEANPDIEIQLDFSSNSTVFEADILMTDWSGISFEYAYTTKKPVLFINTPMKIMNPEYQKIDTVPINIWMREEIGRSVDLDKLDTLPEVVLDLLERKDEYYQIITDFTNEYVYNIGHSGEVGGKYLISAVQAGIKRRKEKQ